MTCPGASVVAVPLVMECEAVLLRNGSCSVIVTHNVCDFAPAVSLGIKARTPFKFLQPFKERLR